MDQSILQRILSCIDACLLPCLYHMRRSQGVGVKTQPPFSSYRF